MTSSTTPGNATGKNGNGTAAPQGNQVLLEMGRTYADAFVRASRAAAEAQNAYLENVLGTLQTQASRPTTSQQGEAFRIWVEALQQANRLTLEATQKGENPPTEEIFDLWTNAFSDMSKAVIWHPTYAAAQGEALNTALDARRRISENTESQMRALGVATRTDLLEVGRRLIELERRQHDLTKTLQAFLDAQESITMVPGAEGEQGTESTGSRGRGNRGKRSSGGA